MIYASYPFVLAQAENAGYRTSFKLCTNLNIYTVWMVALTTLGTGNKTTLLINANSTTHDTDVLSQNELVFGWTQYEAILHSWFFFWLVEWRICLRSLQWIKVHWMELVRRRTMNYATSGHSQMTVTGLHVIHKKGISWKLNHSIRANCENMQTIM